MNTTNEPIESATCEPALDQVASTVLVGDDVYVYFVVMRDHTSHEDFIMSPAYLDQSLAMKRASEMDHVETDNCTYSVDCLPIYADKAPTVELSLRADSRGGEA